MSVAPYLQIAKNYARTTLAVQRGEEPIYWPLITSFYLNNRCNLACSYCDDGWGRKYPDIETDELDTAQVVRILRMMREVNSVVCFTGGEPTLRRDFPQIARAASEMGFLTTVNTNGTSPAVLRAALPWLDAVSVSLDSLDRESSDRVFGAGSGWTQRVIDNLEALVRLRDQGGDFAIIVNCVIHPGNIDGVYDVIDFCWQNRLGLAPLPHLAGFYPSRGLVGNAPYRRLMDQLIDDKRRGYPVEATVECLEWLRDFRKFDCVPMTIARIQPNGDLYFPCNMLHTIGANLLEVSSFREAVALGLAKHGYAPPTCDNRCHISCFIDFSLITQAPSIVLRDGVYRGMGILRRLRERTLGVPPYPIRKRERPLPEPSVLHPRSLLRREAREG